jgi:hypothetical protein
VSDPYSNINGAIMTADEFRAQVIRECIEALPKEAGDTPYDTFAVLEGLRIAHRALEALLLKDRATELVEAFLGSLPVYEMPDGQGADIHRFARWLITNNHIPGEGK